SAASAHTTTCNAVARKGTRPYKGVTDAAGSNVKTSGSTPRMLLILRAIPCVRLRLPVWRVRSRLAGRMPPRAGFRRERQMRRYPDRQEVHQFRLHEGEIVRNLQTDEVFEGWMSGKASAERLS